MASIFYLVSVLIFHSYTQGERTGMLVNDGEYATEDIIDTNVADFETFVSRKKVFVDKTLFVHTLIARRKGYKSILLNFPPKWGKTTNLKMLKYFVQHTLDQNRQVVQRNQTDSYALFHTGKIIRDNNRLVDFNKPPVVGKLKSFMNDYQGRYPVVYLAFRELQGNSHEEFIDCLKEILGQVFREFSYLFDDNLLQASEAEMKKFDNIKDEKENDEDVLLNSLVFLSELLNSTFHEQVFILIDDCDVFLNDTFNDPNYRGKEKTSKFYINFFRITLNENPYLDRGVLTGVLKLTQLGFSPVDFKFIGEFTCIHKPFQEFYGFCTDDVNRLSEYYGLSEVEREKITYWYNGYKATSTKLVMWYNMYSVLNYLLTRNFDTYWTHYGTADFTLARALPVAIFENAMTILVTKSHYGISIYRFHFNMDDFERYKHKQPDTSAGIALEFLIETGYLSMSNKYNSRSCTARIPVKIPNHEVHITLKSKMIQHFVTKFKLSESVDYEFHLKSVERELKAFLLNNKCSSNALKSSLEKYIRILPPFAQQPDHRAGDQNVMHANNDTVRSILNFVFVRNATFRFLGVDDCLFEYQGKGAYFLTRYNDTFNQTELEGSQQYAIWAFRRRIFLKTIKIIELVIMPNKTVLIRDQLIDNALANVTTPPTTADSFRTIRYTPPPTKKWERND